MLTSEVFFRYSEGTRVGYGVENCGIISTYCSSTEANTLPRDSGNIGYASVEQLSIQGAFSSDFFHLVTRLQLLRCSTTLPSIRVLLAMNPFDRIRLPPWRPLALRGIWRHPILQTGNGFPIPGISYCLFARKTWQQQIMVVRVPNLGDRIRNPNHWPGTARKKPPTYMILPAGCSWFIVLGLICIQSL